MLNPWLLLFLPLALVPIILHLITLHRLRTVELSTFRFLMDSYIQQRRRFKLLEWMLMLLRAVFVTLIVLALSRPVVEKFGFLLGTGSGRDVVIAIDHGASTALRTGGTSSLERARATASTLIDLLSPDDHITLIAAGEQPQVLSQGFAINKAALLKKLDELKPTAGATDLGKVLEHVGQAQQHGPRTLYLIGDGLRKTWSSLENNSHAIASLGAETRVVVMHVGSPQPVVNAGVVGDAPRSLRPVVGLPVLLSATVVNSSDQPIDTVLSVMLDDTQATRVNLSLQPGEQVTRPITVVPSRAGAVRGRYSLPGDGFPDDDQFLFCLNVEPSIRVLLVAPPSKDGSGVDDPALFIRSALESPLHAHTAMLKEEQQLAQALSVASLTIEQLDQPKLDNADVVILADVPLDANHGAMLRKYVEDGGGLLIFPGPSVQPDYYQQHLLGAPASSGGSGIVIHPPVGDPDDESSYAVVSGFDPDHPVLGAFAEQDKAYFKTTRIYRFFPLEISPTPATPVAIGQPAPPAPMALLRMPNRAPALIEVQLGEGRLLLASFPATPGWSNLPLKPEFVPLLLRAAAHLHRPAAAQTPSTVKPMQPGTIRISDRWADAQVQVTDPEGKQTTIEMHRSGRHFIGALLQTQTKGFYDVLVTPRSSSAPEEVHLGFAVNLEPQQSILSSLEEPQIRSLLAPVDPIYLRGSSDDPVLAQQLTTRREIWRTLIWVMFIVVGIEFVLSTLNPRAGQPADATEALRPPPTLMRRWVQKFGAIMNRSDLVENK